MVCRKWGKDAYCAGKQAVVGRSPGVLSTPRRVVTHLAGRHTDGVSGAEVCGAGTILLPISVCSRRIVQLSSPSAAAVTGEDMRLNYAVAQTMTKILSACVLTRQVLCTPLSPSMIAKVELEKDVCGE